MKTEKPNAVVEEEHESFIKPTVGPTRTANALVKTLGIFWNNATEEISFNCTELIKSANKMEATKRSPLQLTAKLSIHYHNEMSASLCGEARLGC